MFNYKSAIKGLHKSIMELETRLTNLTNRVWVIDQGQDQMIDHIRLIESQLRSTNAVKDKPISPFRDNTMRDKQEYYKRMAAAILGFKTANDCSALEKPTKDPVNPKGLSIAYMDAIIKRLEGIPSIDAAVKALEYYNLSGEQMSQIIGYLVRKQEYYKAYARCVVNNKDVW